MKTSLFFILHLLILSAVPKFAPAIQPGTAENESSYLIHYWFFGESLPNQQPLLSLDANYGLNAGGLLEYHSALAGYPFNPFHPNWLKASMQRYHAPTSLNYRAEGNSNIPYDEAGMYGIQIRQPFTGDDGENTLIFHLPSSGFRELVFRFAVRDEGAADALVIDYSVSEGEPEWITTGMTTNVFSITDTYEMMEVSFTDSATQSPPPPPGHGLGEDQLSGGTFMLVNDNPGFKIRIRFSGDDMSADEGQRVVFNNFSLEGKFTAETVQTIPLPEGWSGISAYVMPDNTSIEHIFNPAANALIIAQNFDGIYWPEENTNTLGNWNNFTGYAVKTNRDAQIFIAGDLPEDPVLPLGQGWSLLPVMNNCVHDVAELFNIITNKVVIIKEVAGSQVYWPGQGINNLVSLMPGKAYFILMNEDASLSFPGCGNDPEFLPVGMTDVNGRSGSETEIPDKSGDLPAIKKTIFTHTIAIPSFLSGQLLPGDVIGAYDDSGQCFGKVVWNNESTALSMFGNDGTSPAKDGFDEHEPFGLRLYRPATAETFVLDVAYDPTLPNNLGLFAANGLSAISGIRFLNTGMADTAAELQLYMFPNPAQHEFVISVVNRSFDEGMVRIFSAAGTLVMEAGINRNPSTVVVDALKPGVYTVQINIDGTVVNRRLVKY
jgi:hypothetical protein